MKQFWMVVGLLLLTALQAAPAFASADWEWSRDKGWTQGLGQAKPTPVEQINFAWSLEQDGQYLNATKQYFLLLKTYPDSEEAGRGLQRLAVCLFQMENFYDSYKALEQVVKSYPMSAGKTALLKLEFLIGRKFQEGARKDLLNDKELPTVSQNTAIEIFKSVLENDPVGPYAGSATLAIAECYKKLNDAQQGIIYCDRVLNEFSSSTDLVGKARILKTTLEVMQGKADIKQAEHVIKQTQQAMADEEKKKAALAKSGQAPAGGQNNGQDAADQDLAPITNYNDELKELEEQQAKKIWDSAEFYKNRGSRDSISAYKFSMEQIVLRFPNTSYAAKARKVVGTVKIPPKDNSYIKWNLPLVSKPKEPDFRVQGNTPNYVDAGAVPVPGLENGAEKDLADGSSALVNPVAPPALVPAPASAAGAAPAGKGNKAGAKGAIAQAPANAGAGANPAVTRASADAPEGFDAMPQVPDRGGATPPGVSGAGIRPGALGQSSAAGAAPKTPVNAAAVAPLSSRASADAPGAVDDAAVPVRALPQGGDRMAPPSSGSSAIPAAIRKNPGASAIPSRPVSTTAASAPATTAAAGMSPAARTSSNYGGSADASANGDSAYIPAPAAAVPAAPAAPIAPAAPVAVDPAVKAATDAANSKARTSANEAAAKTGSWAFSDEFQQ